MTATTHRTVATRPEVLPLVERLRPIAESGADAARIALDVADVLMAMNPGPGILTADERVGSAEAYTRHTLHAEDSFSLVGIVWRPGQLTEIHDHLVWCSFLILQGTESETLYMPDGDGLRVVGELQRPVGSASGSAPPDDIHRVANTGTETAITLHAYGADLSDGSSVRRYYADALVAPRS
jgi:predicted metal-dependent enzyme (double-stranded beta helix superfamily)